MMRIFAFCLHKFENFLLLRGLLGFACASRLPVALLLYGALLGG